MRKPARLAAVIAIALLAAVLVPCALVVRRGISTRREPSSVEALLARSVRSMAMPAAASASRNPIPLDAETLSEGKEHFADHCALCHGNDGKGQTEIGKHLYPRAPDMTDRPTQSLSDGQLFFIIKNGVRLTGMPA